MVAGGAQVFLGSYEIGNKGLDVLAALCTVPVTGGGALTIELKDVEGLAAVGPVLLRRLTVSLLAPNPC